MHLRLSDAIILGDTLRQRSRMTYLKKNDIGFCGCAIGGALLATGFDDYKFVDQVWPWLKDDCARKPSGFMKWDNDMEISFQFMKVCDGEQTIEQLADYVRSIEPDEPVQKMDETPTYNTVPEENACLSI